MVEESIATLERLCALHRVEAHAPPLGALRVVVLRRVDAGGVRHPARLACVCAPKAGCAVAVEGGLSAGSGGGVRDRRPSALYGVYYD